MCAMNWATAPVTASASRCWSSGRCGLAYSGMACPMTSIISGTAPLSLAWTRTAVCADRAGPDRSRVASASSRILSHRPDARSAPRNQPIRYQ
jgi:hypothetical protein